MWWYVRSVVGVFWLVCFGVIGWVVFRIGCC